MLTMKEDSEIESIIEFHTNTSFGALVETGKFYDEEISLVIPFFSQNKIKTLKKIEVDLKNHTYYFLFSLKNARSEYSTPNLFMYRLEDVWRRVLTKEYAIFSLDGSALNAEDFLELKRYLKKQESPFFHIHGLVLKSTGKINPDEIKKIGLAYFLLTEEV